jgi:hypothetical protein
LAETSIEKLSVQKEKTHMEKEMRKQARKCEKFEPKNINARTDDYKSTKLNIFVQNAIDVW